MRKVLSISYSQTGQLSNITDSILKSLESSDEIEIERLIIKPEKEFPFPWPFFKFFRIFPETVSMDPIPLEAMSTKHQQYDLILLSYQVWFLTPSLPITSFLQSEQAKTLFSGTPVVTIIGCRGMWLAAQEKMKQLLIQLNAKLIDNVVLTDECGAWFSFLATPLWMFTGKKKPVSWIPRAGISDEKIAESDRFGTAIRKRLELNDSVILEPMLQGLSAVAVNEKLIASERVGAHSFSIWSKILKKFGSQDSAGRLLGLIVYITFLLTLIITIVPITALLKKIFSPLLRKKTAQQKEYYAQPSGE